MEHLLPASLQVAAISRTPADRSALILISAIFSCYLISNVSTERFLIDSVGESTPSHEIASMQIANMYSWYIHVYIVGK